MKDRVAIVRKAAGLSQSEMAERLNLSRNFISLIENGNRVPSDRTISDICREFRVNEKWLRTGEGVRKPPELDEETAVIEKFLDDIDDPVRGIVTAIIKTYMDSDPGDKEAIKGFAKKLLESNK